MTVERLLEKADKQQDYGNYAKALVLYERALAELRTPKEEQREYLEIMSAIADNYLYESKNDEALKLYDTIMEHPSADDVPYLHLRRGQAAYDHDNKELASVELKRAYELGGDKLFEGEGEIYLAVATGTELEK